MKPPISRTAQWAWLWAHVAYYLVANVIQVFVWWFSTPEKAFWPVWSIVFWGVGLGFHAWAVASGRTEHAR
jgi:hypothetical protein